MVRNAIVLRSKDDGGYTPISAHDEIIDMLGLRDAQIRRRGSD